MAPKTTKGIINIFCNFITIVQRYIFLFPFKSTNMMLALNMHNKTIGKLKSTQTCCCAVAHRYNSNLFVSND